ncbi:MAG TPA: peroxiredoxin [Nakamurella sp.]
MSGAGLAEGTVAPDFTLPDANKAPVSLSSFRGQQPVLLVFYPFAFTSTCTGELCQLRDDLFTFTDAGVQVLAISCDTSQSLKVWTAQQGYQFPLLSDFWPHGAVAQSYDVFSDRAGMASRGTFLVDVDGVIRFAEVNPPGQARDQSAWQRAVDALAPAG